MSVKLSAFEFIEPAGEGATATVWQARHHDARRLVAVKILPPISSNQGSKLRRFRAEVRSVAELNHPGIVRLYDHGMVHDEIALDRIGVVPSGSAFIVMEWIDGGDLHAHFDALDWDQSREILLAILDALSAAHARGTIHRDIKPQNVLLSPRGPLITDFGIAFAGDFAAIGDEEDVVIGTPSYLAPEQIRARWRQYGPWTDLYGLGCLAYAMVCGRPPYKAAEPLDTMRLHLKAPIPALEPRYPVPAGLDEWISMLLQKGHRARFQFAADAAHGLSSLGAPASSWTGFTQPLLADSSMETMVVESVFEGTAVSLPPFVELDEASQGSSSYATTDMPPMPVSWRAPRPPLERSQLAGLGLSVFSIANAPFCGREQERDLLWKQIKRSAIQRKLTVSVIRGTAGSGKTSLATWIARRAHELGVAHVLNMSHVQGYSQSDGVSQMLETFFRAQGLRDLELREAVQARLGPSAPPTLSRGLAALMSPDLSFRDDDGAVTLFQPTERRGAIFDFLTFLAAERAVVLVIDDLQWGANALVLLKEMLSSRLDLAVAILVTVRDYAPSPIPRWPERLEALVSSKVVKSISLGPLSPEACLALIRSRIALSDRLANRLIARTEGNPLFAEELVRQWLHDGLLELGTDGYRLKPGAKTALPEGLHELWQRRLEGAMESALDADWAALEIASALGRVFSGKVWRKAVDLRGLPVSGELLDRLADHGLLRSDDDFDWGFSHALLRESVQLRAQQNGRWASSHGIAADAMIALESSDDERIATHLLSARRYADAVSHLQRAAQKRRIFGEYRAAADLCIALAFVYRSLHYPRTDRRWNELRVLWSVLQRVRGNRRNAALHAKRILEYADPNTQAELRGQAYKELGANAADVIDALNFLELGVAEVDACPPSFHKVAVLLEMSRNLANVNRLRDARNYARQADQVIDACPVDGGPFGPLRLERLRASLSMQTGIIYHVAGRYTEAKQHYERAYATGATIGARFTMGYASDSLGKLAHIAEDWDAAEDHFLHASELWTEIGNFVAHGATLNRALMEADRGAGAAACLLADAAIQAFTEDGSTNMAIQCTLQAAYCYARHGDWEGADERLQPARTDLGYSLLDVETLELFQKIVAFADADRETERANALADIVLRRARDLQLADMITWAEART